MTITPDARLVFATLTGYGYITRWRLDGDVSSIAKDPACPNFREMAPSGGSAASSAPTERHVAVAKRCLSVPELRERLETGGAYAVQPDGSLDEITSASIPYNSPQGSGGF